MSGECKCVEERLARLEERVEGFDRARALQAEEYARRLDELNHAHERALEDRAGFVDRSVCDLRHNVVDARVAELKEVQAVAKGKGIVYGLGFSLLLALIAVLLKVIK